jgi:hypothetical protein
MPIDKQSNEILIIDGVRLRPRDADEPGWLRADFCPGTGVTIDSSRYPTLDADDCDALAAWLIAAGKQLRGSS